MSEIENKKHVILGQKYAYATISLLLGIFCFINLAGMEKAVLAIVFAWLALRSSPEPILRQRRVWAQAGFALGGLALIIVPVIIFFTFGRLREIFEVLLKMSNGR
ncbi:MAG TPA: hypothetical protein VK400_03780 [Pyrinomonadaceae bacterium]|nr:hypothetical protein [Pyrinomonadaceae bacterium]